jgi:uncharacterized protein YihD (DUF1040 family)
MFKTSLLLIVLVVYVSCDYIKQGPDKQPVARVNDIFLFPEDLEGLITEDTSKEDSTLIVNNYINRWATRQLLIDKAKINLSETQLATFDRLVEEYKNDLYTEAYKSAIVSGQLDSNITNQEFVDFYEFRKENFKLNSELVKLRYIHAPVNFSALSQTKEMFLRFNTKDKEALNDLSLKFKSVSLNDSVWVSKEALLKVLPVLQKNSNEVLKKSNFAQLQDSLGVYLVKIEDLLKPNDISPLSHVKPTIEQIILNKRKLELIKKLEKDITKDAIKNNDFEIYPPR